jgi:hypothetical protein
MSVHFKQNDNYEYDLMLGLIAEKGVAEILQNQQIEVKRDFRALETGNVFIEYKLRDRPSGLSTSTASFYCFVLSESKMIFIKSSELKEICRPYIGTSRDILGGDNMHSKGILLPIKELFNV